MLITPEYRELNRQLHAENAMFGQNSNTGAILAYCKQLRTKDVLDYGCGKGMLAKSLPFEIQSYDPAIEEYSAPPRPAELVVCTDVLEHVEPECLDAVLADLQQLTLVAGLFVIDVLPAQKLLSDGRNAHINLHTREWWFNKLSEYFRVGVFVATGNGCQINVRPL